MSKGFLIGIVLGVLCLIVSNASDYMESKPVSVTVVDRFIPAGGYKSSASPVLVLRTDDGQMFDRYVSYSTYVLAEKGARLTFDMRRFDIRQTGRENLLFFFLPLLLGAGAIVSVIMAAIAKLVV